VPSALVGKKVAHIGSNSGSNNEIESLGSSLTDDKEILECLLNLPCISSNKKQRQAKHRKLITDITAKEKAKTLVTLYSQNHCHACKSRPKKKAETLVTEFNHCYICDSNVEHSYVNLPEDMVEDNPLDLENIKEKQTMIFLSPYCDIQLGTVARTSMMSRTYYAAIPNQATMQPIGKQYYQET
jgi:hypothetical protein